MHATWIVVADEARGRIFEIQQQGHLAEIENFVNPSERERNSDLRTDAYGRFYGKGERDQGHSAEPPVHPREHEAELFALRIAEFLDHARNTNRYSKLYIFAAPRFLGLLRDKLPEEVMKLVDLQLDQDLTKASIGELEQRLQQSLH